MFEADVKPKLKRLWTESVAAPQRPASNTDESKYLRSYLRLRLMVGVMGILMPIVLFLGDAFLRAQFSLPRSSLSAYYHSGMRDEYVIVLVITGVVLITYKVASRDLGNIVSTAAGLAVIVVALAPTGLPPGCSPNGKEVPAGCPSLTRLQERLGEGTLAGVHQWSSILFIGLMIVLSVMFAIQEGNRGRRQDAHPPVFWKRFHFACAAVMAVVVVFNGITDCLDVWQSWSLTLTESTCAFAFGVSWCAKGLELPYL